MVRPTNRQESRKCNTSAKVGLTVTRQQRFLVYYKNTIWAKGKEATTSQNEMLGTVLTWKKSMRNILVHAHQSASSYSDNGRS